MLTNVLAYWDIPGNVTAVLVSSPATVETVVVAAGGITATREFSTFPSGIGLK
jgi:hypothetical protein